MQGVRERAAAAGSGLRFCCLLLRAAADCVEDLKGYPVVHLKP